MKKSLFVLCLVMVSLLSSGQSWEIEPLLLGVEKISNYDQVSYIFKDGKALRIKTIEGSEFTSKYYQIFEEYIVFNHTDTILYEDIQLIKGKVYGDPGRKILGGVITGYGIVGGFLGIVVMHAFYGGAAWLAVAIPFSGITAGGINMLGARKFKSQGWRVITLPVQEEKLSDILLPEEIIRIKN